MLRSRQLLISIAAAVTVCLVVGVAGTPVLAQPSAAQTAEDRARVDSALEELESARIESARIETRLAEVSQELDRVVAEQQRALDGIHSRAAMMYRSGRATYLSVLLGATTFEEFASRWDLLMEMNRRDAEDVRTLEIARVEAARSAESLMDLQVEQARAMDAMTREVERARTELAASEAALKEYEARVAEEAVRAAEPESAPQPSDSTQQLSGSGAWLTAVASHYGRSFTGRGASGEEIGPYSMIVAHKTLPFGTLIEIEYNGKRAVASVSDRGPHTEGRDFDLGPGVVRVLDFSGVHEIRYRIIAR
jgi:rare lipoprotein A (peptidoglycan hydrolase)